MKVDLRKERGGGVLFCFLFCFLFLTQVVHADVVSLPFWDQVPEAVQELFQSDAGADAVLALVLERESELPLLFTAAALNMLADQGLENLLPKLLLALDDRDRSLEILRGRVDLYLLSNRSADARMLSETLAALFPTYSTYTDSVAINLSLGLLGEARSSLSTYLEGNTQQSPNEYVESLFLIAQLFLAEDNEDAAEKVLRNYFEQEHNALNSLYYVHNAHTLRELLRARGATNAAGRDLLKKLDSIVGSAGTSFLLQDTALVYPDLRVLDSLEEDSLVFPSLGAVEEKDTGVASGTGNRSSLSAPPSSSAPSSASSSSTSTSTSSSSSTSTSSSSENTDILISSAGLIQIGSFSQEGNALNYIKHVESIPHEAFVYFNDDSFKVFVDPHSAQYRGTVNAGNPRRLLLVLKEDGVEGFIVSDPR